MKKNTTHTRMFTTLNDQSQLLLNQHPQRHTIRLAPPKFVRADLGVPCHRTRVGEQERFEIVVHGVSDEDFVLDEGGYSSLDF